MPDSSQPSPIPWRYGELVTFAPAEQWWALVEIGLGRTYRQKIAGWGTYSAGGKLHVVPMVAGGSGLSPAPSWVGYVGMWHDGQTICDCGNTGGDVHDPWWCYRCAAEIS